ncbi:ABC transporter ATP-binding protein [Spiroplasma helicoides]|uniref:ABC transporter ATP-binding protein n=1 Tax=Spiroplasma helicoides TaxID=216938 RepID=A0A1B3SK41_9MOLU|nr:ABC transporter ATP-binding protein [Spiroplasma helicoides]AOG60299.1 ABC transporter ATP-binding protein [Spiroplasma helicoides]
MVNQEFKIKGPRFLLGHTLKALKRKKITSIIMIAINLVIALLLIINIKIIEDVTALLVSKSILDAGADTNKIEEILKSIGKSQQEIDMFMQALGTVDRDQLLMAIINEFFYDFVHYSDGGLYIEVLGMQYNLFSFAFTMIGDLMIVILLSYIVFVMSGWIAQSYETYIRRQVINKLIDQDLHYFSENKTNELVSTLVKDTRVLASFIKEAPATYIRSISTIIASAAVMFSIDWKLAACVFGLLVVCLTGVMVSAKISARSTRNIQKLTQSAENEMSEKVYSIRLIKSSGTFEKEKDYFQDLNKVVDKKNKVKLFISEVSSALIIGGIGSFSMASVIFGVFLYHDQSQTLISIITSFSSGVIVMTLPLIQSRQTISEAPNAKISGENIVKLLTSEIYIDKHQKQVFDQKVDCINFKKVSFSYPDSDKKIIKNLNIKLERGKKYAFVGPTGSGKSTIAKLLLRFYDTTEGSLIINNNINIKDLNLKSWLDKVGYVDQEPQILSGTIFENIKYGLENISEEQVIDAAKKAKLHDLIMTWEEGYNTVLFERGSQLSGGQKQRLVIARLILKNPEVLILDEATSALDNIVEKEIQEELEKLMVGRTTVSIAHRLSTIKTFDEIFVIEPNVGVVQSGSYEKLINEQGLFKVLYEISK